MAGVDRRVERIVIDNVTRKIPTKSIRRLSFNLVGGLSEGTAVDTGFAASFHEARAGRPASHSITPGRPTEGEVGSAKSRAEAGTRRVATNYELNQGNIYITSVPYFPELDRDHKGPGVPATRGVIRRVLREEVRKERRRIAAENRL